MSHAITVDRPLRMDKIDAIPGFENRCSWLMDARGLQNGSARLSLRPDMVVSGSTLAKTLARTCFIRALFLRPSRAFCWASPQWQYPKWRGAEASRDFCSGGSELFQNNLGLLRKDGYPQMAF